MNAKLDQCRAQRYRCYYRAVDEESGEQSWQRTGHPNPKFYATREEAQAAGRAMVHDNAHVRGFAVRATGEPAPKCAPYASDSERRAVLREQLDGMCPEERDAYFGR